MDGVCKPISEYLAMKRQSAPDKPPLCYHTATYNADDNMWTLQQVIGTFSRLFFLDLHAQFFSNSQLQPPGPCLNAPAKNQGGQGSLLSCHGWAKGYPEFMCKSLPCLIMEKFMDRDCVASPRGFAGSSASPASGGEHSLMWVGLK